MKSKTSLPFINPNFCFSRAYLFFVFCFLVALVIIFAGLQPLNCSAICGESASSTCSDACMHAAQGLKERDGMAYTAGRGAGYASSSFFFTPSFSSSASSSFSSASSAEEGNVTAKSFKISAMFGFQRLKR